MNKSKKISSYNKVYLILLIAASLFMGVGYASVNSVSLDINGDVASKEQSGVYITDVKYKSDVNANVGNSEIINAYQTVLNSRVELSDSDYNSSITYSVTVYNSSESTYYFDKVEYLNDSSTYSNNDITFELTGLKNGDALSGKQTMTFDITFKYVDDITEIKNSILNSYLNFSFKRIFSISYVNIAYANLSDSITEGETLSLNLEKKAPENIKVYIDEVLTTEYTYENFSLTIPNVSGNIKIVGEIESPNLFSNDLIPIYHDGTSWIVANTDSDWYNYGSQEWANAVLLNDGISLNPGDVVDVSTDVRAMFVWIPRYEYKISTDGSNEIFVNFISKDKTTPTSGYTIHPAFTFGTTQLGGIWVGKFETSTSKSSSCYSSTTFANCNNSSLELYVLPNVKSLREQTISTQYNSAKGFTQYFSSSSINSHMMKNSEWGATAYLSQSKYGKYGNENYSSSNKEVYVNNSTELYTGRSSGSNSYISSYEKSYNYDYGFSNGTLISEENGVGASTTGNITGVYDMNGGTYEYVMGYLTTASSTFGATSIYNYAEFSSTPESKYYDKYTSSSSTIACSGGICYGHAVDETSGWYGDSASFVTNENPWFMRGGVFDMGASSGIFAYTGTIGYSGAYATFRISLVDES